MGLAFGVGGVFRVQLRGVGGVDVGVFVGHGTVLEFVGVGVVGVEVSDGEGDADSVGEVEVSLGGSLFFEGCEDGKKKKES